MTARCRRLAWSLLVAVGGLFAFSGPALAHGGSLGSAGRQTVTVPTWLVLLTGGAAVGASFLLASFVTDRRLVRDIESWTRPLLSSGPMLRVVAGLVRILGVVLLAVTIAVGLVGPQQPLANFGLLFVWVGWWAGFTMTTYLLGNAWPALNPWRTVAALLPTLDRSYPDGLGVWPATGALLALVWVEVASPIADVPAVLVGVIVTYSLVTLAGAVVFGPETWFARADPVSRVFDHYGHVATLQHDGDGLAARVPGEALRDLSLTTRSEVAFVVALLWVTTFDGFVATPAWTTIVDVATPTVPLVALYPLALVAGFGLFLAAFYGAARASRRTADTYLTAATLARRFAPSLLAIAAGYHLAHYLGYFLSLLPALAAVATAPLSPPAEVTLLVLPGWFETVGMVTILLGHLLAIWVAHGTAYAIFPGRLQAIRSQYPFILVMVCYTMTSLWIIAQPEVPPP
ncbi:hypothetical protein [Salinibaculum rarum]|uniref:hypothetical protein n=1 Tax=Salinibaculum rarum TaxID=3058903 RepID=UPI00265F7955|nr:hypothetical protein [Salinibaculum sp. KK48]